MPKYINREDVYKLFDDSGVARLHVSDIDQIPLADVSPVVRCKDCKHYREFRTKRYKQPMRMCYRMGKYDMEYRVKPDDFCSYGEKRMEEVRK